VTTVPFLPEAAPAATPTNSGPFCDDCVAYNIQIGFPFSFYGVPYTQLNLSSNGFVQFGGAVGTVPQGCCSGGHIPSADFLNNIIAVAWVDWLPTAGGSYRYETSGAPGSRKFILQWTNVPEYGGYGRLTAQLVLSEGSNDITIYTKSLTNSGYPYHLITQGIENAFGTEATFVSGRVEALYSLTEDAIRFTTGHANTAPTIVAPAPITVSTDPGVCTATVSALGDPTVTDDGHYGVGNNAPADGVFPLGSTTVSWTATDDGGLSASADQTVTVTDNENPTITAPAPRVVNTDPGQPWATVSGLVATGTDNCGTPTISGPTGGTFPLGTTIIAYTSTDGSGNSVSASSSITVEDHEAPTLTVPASFTVNATAPSGAVVNFATSALDNSGSVSVTCDHPSGSSFAIGTTAVICTATDGSGNTNTKNFNVTVLGAQDQLRNLIGLTSGLSLQQGTSSPLLAMLATALRDPGINSPAVACGKLDDFIRKLQDHKASAIASISPTLLTSMIGDATRIKAVLGC
jgi:hypothetical protein